MTASTAPQQRTLPYEGHFDLRRTLGPLQRGQRDPCFALSRTEAVKASRTPEGPATLRLVVDEPGLVKAEAWGPGADWSLAHVVALCGLDEQPVRLPTAAEGGHPLVDEAARRAQGMRLCRTHRVFEVLVPVVLEQLVTGIEFKRAWRRLVGAFAEPAPGPYPDLYLPPSPEQVKSVPSDEFLSLGILRKQGLTLRRIAERAGRLEEAATMEPNDAYRWLTLVKGVGPWTAGTVQLVALGHADAVPVGDYHLPNVVAWNLAGEARADDARMLELLEPWRGQRGRVLRMLTGAGSAAPKFGPRRAVRTVGRPAWAKG